MLSLSLPTDTEKITSQVQDRKGGGEKEEQDKGGDRQEEREKEKEVQQQKIPSTILYFGLQMLMRLIEHHSLSLTEN